MSEQTGELHTIIVVRVAPDSVDAAAARLAERFQIDPEVALQIVKSAPIRFLTDVSRDELRGIRSKLRAASEAGIEFKVTLESDEKIPKVNWPVRPELTADESPEQTETAPDESPAEEAAPPAEDGEPAEPVDEAPRVRCKCCNRVFRYRRSGTCGVHGARTQRARPPVRKPVRRAAEPDVTPVAAAVAEAPAPETDQEPAADLTPAAIEPVAVEKPEEDQAAVAATPAEEQAAEVAEKAEAEVEAPAGEKVEEGKAEEKEEKAGEAAEEKSEAEPEDKPEEQSEAEAPAAEEKPVAEKPADEEPAEAEPAEEKPVEAEAVEEKPADEEAAEAEAGEPEAKPEDKPEPVPESAEDGAKTEEETAEPVKPEAPVAIESKGEEEPAPEEKPAEAPAAEKKEEAPVALAAEEPAKPEEEPEIELEPEESPTPAAPASAAPPPAAPPKPVARGITSPLDLLKPREVVLRSQGAPEPVGQKGGSVPVTHGLPQLFPQASGAQPSAFAQKPPAASGVVHPPAARPGVPSSIRSTTGSTGRFPVPPSIRPPVSKPPRPAARLVSPTVRLTAEEIARAAKSSSRAPEITTRVSWPGEAKPGAPAPAAPPAQKAAPAPPTRKPLPSVPAAVRMSTGTTGRFPIPGTVKPQIPGIPVPQASAPAAPPAGAPPAARQEAAPAPAPPQAAPPPKPADQHVEVPSGIQKIAEPVEEKDQPETYNVFLSQISNEEKRVQAAKLISEIRKCSMDDANELVTRSMIPVLKNVQKSEAEVVLHRFRMIKVAGRMTLARKR